MAAAHNQPIAGEDRSGPRNAPLAILRILELADLVKFADFRPPTPQSRMILGETRKTVDVIEAKLRQIAMDRERLTPRVYPIPETETEESVNV